MKNNKVRNASLLLLGTLAGCSLLQPGSREDRVSNALSEQDYAKAIEIINSTNEKDPQYPLLQQQYPGVLQANEQYRKQIQHQALALGRQHHWQQAFTLIDDAEPRIADPASLEELRGTLQSREQREFHQLLAERRLAQAQAWLAHPKLSEQLSGFQAPNARKEAKQLEDEKQQLVQDLIALGNEQAEQQHWHQARDLLAAAHQLTPEQPAEPMLTKARRILNNAEQKADARRNQDLQQHAEALMSQYQESGQLEDLLAIRSFLAKHRGNSALAKQRQRTEQWSRRRFAEEMNTGEALYARGQYREAYRVWKQVKPLYPDNVELNKKLERSRRVLNNLRSLKQS
ncbi:MAG: hypothetical protein R3292_03095 [Alcanivorax sp.]|nr:hypothetical protein [Alcanivorax sp.]